VGNPVPARANDLEKIFHTASTAVGKPTFLAQARRMPGSLGGFGASSTRLIGEIHMLKNVVVAALLSTVAAVSFAQTPAAAPAAVKAAAPVVEAAKAAAPTAVAAPAAAVKTVAAPAASPAAAAVAPAAPAVKATAAGDMAKPMVAKKEKRKFGKKKMKKSAAAK
jgi:hypothetical protein